MARLSRRDFLRLTTSGLGALVYTACSGAPPPTPASGPAPTAAASTAAPTARPTPPPAVDTPLVGQAALPPEFAAGRLTPVADFYVQSHDGPRSLAVSRWALDVTGLVETPLHLTWQDLLTFPTRQQMHTLECIGNPVGGRLIGNALWQGVPVAAVLSAAGVRPSAAFVGFSCEDEYATSVPLKQVMHERSLLAYQMGGAPLPASHGFPVRILIPGVYGQKQPKWVVGLHLSDRYTPGTWEKQGWSDSAVIQPNSRVETPQAQQAIPAGKPFYVTGIAMTNLSGVERVEVTTDGGKSWNEAELFPGPHESVWTLWAWRWHNPAPGRHVVMARATNREGATQEEPGGVLSGVFPDGTSDMHTVPIRSVGGG